MRVKSAAQDVDNEPKALPPKLPPRGKLRQEGGELVAVALSPGPRVEPDQTVHAPVHAWASRRNPVAVTAAAWDR